MRSSGRASSRGTPAPVTLTDVVGAVEPPMAFAMPDTTPLESSAVRPDAPRPDLPADPPQGYQASPHQPPLSSLVPQTGETRDPSLPFSSTGVPIQWGRHAEIDPRRPILTSGGPAGWGGSPLTGPEPSSPSSAVQSGLEPSGPAHWSAARRGSARSGSDRWAPPEPALDNGLNLAPAEPSGLWGERPELPGNRTLGALCRGLGWGLVASVVAGCLGTWLSLPALAVGWYFTWRHPVARTALLRLYGVATALALLMTVLGSPTRSGWEQLRWTCWMANIAILVASMIIIDRELTPTPRTDPSQGRQGISR